MKIGLDFDGVIANTPWLKCEYAKRYFGINLLIKDPSMESALEKGLTNKQYGWLQGKVYSSMEIKPLPCALTYIRKLSKNHDLRIISYRFERKTNVIDFFLQKNNLNLPFIYTNNKPKEKFAKGLDIFVDDRAEHLNSLSNIIPYLFLFDAPYNRKIKLDNGIKRIRGWKNLYEIIKSL